jgi:hypothetical protein
MARSREVSPGEQLKKLKAEIEKHRARAEKEGHNFTAPTDDQLREKLGRVNSPMIVSQGWSGAPAGGTVSYSVGLHNPDPTPWNSLFVHLFVGAANIPPSVGEALALVDTRFPRLTQPDLAGLQLAAGATQQLNFTLQVPAGVERTNYLGNSFLFQSLWHDPGLYLDRSIFVFKVT